MQYKKYKNTIKNKKVSKLIKMKDANNISTTEELIELLAEYIDYLPMFNDEEDTKDKEYM